MYVYYRISDKGNPKEKIIGASKEQCLKNACAEFGSSIIVIADNCLDTTIKFIRDLGVDYIESSLGNSKSFMFMLDLILSKHADDDIVYLLEDDYFHLPGSKDILLEGLEFADFVTLYDHPDKYQLFSEGGSPLNQEDLHDTHVRITKSSHWREIDSTTMTFACRVGTLRETRNIWKKNTITRNPDDFHAFIELTQNTLAVARILRKSGYKRATKIVLRNFFLRKRIFRLISCVPAHSTHAEVKWLSPVIDWNK